MCTFLFYYILIGCKIQSLFCLYHWQSAVLSMYFPVNGRVRSIRVCGEDGNVIDNEITARRYPGRAAVEIVGSFCKSESRSMGRHQVIVQRLVGIVTASARLGDSGNSHEDFGYFIPGSVVGDACLGQVEDPLENADCLRRGRTVNAVRRNSGNGGVIPGDTVQLRLKLPDFIAGSAYT